MCRFPITRRILLVGLLASVVLVAARPTVADDGGDFVRVGQEMVAKGRYDVALVLFQRAEQAKGLTDVMRRRACDGLAEAYVGRGQIAMAHGRYDAAAADFARALKIRPKNRTARRFRARNFLERGRMLFTKGRYARSVRNYTAAIDSGSLEVADLGAAYFLRARSLQRIGRDKKAMLDYAEAIATGSLSPKIQARAYYARGLYFSGYMRLRLAIVELSEAVEADPRFADAYYHRGRVLVIKGKRARAMADFRKALALDPGKRVARRMLRQLMKAR